MRVLEPLAEQLVLITGNYPESDIFSPKIKLINLRTDSKSQSILIRAPKFVLTQLKMAFYLAKNLKQTSIVIFFLDGGTLLLPALVAKLAHRKIFRVITHSSSLIAKQSYKNNKEGKYYEISTSILECLNYSLSGKLIVYSNNLISDFNLNKYKNKIIIAHEHFIDFDKFQVRTRLNERENNIGYIGRLDEEKGILNIVKAIPSIIKENKGIKFFIVGDGQLKSEIDKYLNEENLKNKVECYGWVTHDELPKYLNKLKLMVLPSYTEGLPNVMLEAMACGTPVLATPVGAIPDFIKDGETGFIMEDNSPECIASNILRAVNHPNLEQIANNGRAMVEEGFTFEKAVEGYRKILTNL